MNKKKLFVLLLALPLLAGFGSEVYADPACDTEIVAIKAGLDTPNANISPNNLEQARNLLNVIIKDCDGGTPFETVAPIAQQIRSLLGIGGGSLKPLNHIHG